VPDRKLDRLVKPPAAGGKATSLVVLLHGLGANAEDLMGLAPYWEQALPHTEFVAPDAPEPCDMAPFGFQWFSLQDRSPLAMMRGVQSAAPILDAFLDELLADRALDPGRLALVGFSQGTMMSLHVGLRRAAAPAAIVGYSGALLAGPELLVQIRARPPVLLVHGDADPVVPVSALDAAAIGLRSAGVNVTYERRPGLGHSIDEVGLELGGAFLVTAFGAQK
jgi:phospholipase/carboxylesterase